MNNYVYDLNLSKFLVNSKNSLNESINNNLYIMDQINSLQAQNQKLYEENGFIDAVISDMPIEDISENVEQKGYMFRLPIRIVEGQQWKLGSVVFIGVEKLNENDLKKQE